MTRRLLPIALAILLALALGSCGDKPATIANGESEASYVTLGDLQYQVQISRQLNAAEVGDRDYLVGLPAGDRTLKPKEVWFGVWIRVTNNSGVAHRSANTFKIVDTRGREYAPLGMARVNRFVYRPAPVQDQSRLPIPGSAADGTPTSGALLVYRLPAEALDFRPLELVFSDSTRPKVESTIRLDV